MNFVVTRDDSTNVRDNLKDVVVSLCIGALLATLIVFLFLHNFRATVIVAIAIPTCIVATFLPIAAFGFTLNSLTLLGLSLAIGILIDDSIVVIENISRHLAMGQEPKEAAIAGRSEIGLAALTLTAVDLVVFIPIAFMGGIIGEFFRSFGVSISVAVLISLFVSFTLTPMLASRWFRKGESLESTGEGRRGLRGGLRPRLPPVRELLPERPARLPAPPLDRRRSRQRHPDHRGRRDLPEIGLPLLARPGPEPGVCQRASASAGTSLNVTKGITDEIEHRIRADKSTGR